MSLLDTRVYSGSNRPEHVKNKQVDRRDCLIVVQTNKLDGSLLSGRFVIQGMLSRGLRVYVENFYQ